jgi:hypothetical protein
MSDRRGRSPRNESYVEHDGLRATACVEAACLPQQPGRETTGTDMSQTAVLKIGGPGGLVRM